MTPNMSTRCTCARVGVKSQKVLEFRDSTTAVATGHVLLVYLWDSTMNCKFYGATVGSMLCSSPEC